MKKFVASIVTLGVLVAYSIGIRHQTSKTSSVSQTTNANPSTATGASVPQPSSTINASNSSSQSNSNTYKDGSYTGNTADAYYGNVQVKATISGGKITSVTFLQYPDTHSNSIYINQQAMPYLQQEAIKAQNSDVNIVSGATYTSQAFIESLGNALSQAS